MKKVFIVLLAMVFAFSLAACGSGGSDGGDKDGDSGKEKKVERVTTKSGAISVEALDMPDYITEADDDDEEILMAKDISKEFDITPQRTASIMDIFSCVWQGIIPYGAQLLIASGLAGISSLSIIPFLFYQFLLFISAILFIIFKK